MNRKHNSRENIFEHPIPNKSDLPLLATLLIITVAVDLAGYLQATSLQNPGSIYFDLVVVNFIFILIALATKFEVTAWVFFGKLKTNRAFFTSVILAIAAIVALQIIPSFTGLSIAIPLSIGSALGAGTNAEYTVLSFFGPITEEIFVWGIILPSMYLLFRKKSDLLTGGMIVGAMFALFMGFTYANATPIIIIGIFLLLVSIIATFNKVSHFLNRLPFDDVWIVAILAESLILLLHIYSYGTITADPAAYIGAAVFFFFEFVLDYYSQSIVPSIIMHISNNSIIAAEQLNVAPVLGLPIWVFMIAIGILFLYALFRSRFLDLSKTPPFQWFQVNFRGIY